MLHPPKTGEAKSGLACERKWPGFVDLVWRQLGPHGALVAGNRQVHVRSFGSTA
jgi:hypothetical protein